MVVRFVCVVCVPLCVRVFRVSRVCPGSPRCLFTGKGVNCCSMRPAPFLRGSVCPIFKRLSNFSVNHSLFFTAGQLMCQKLKTVLTPNLYLKINTVVVLRLW